MNRIPEAYGAPIQTLNRAVHIMEGLSNTYTNIFMSVKMKMKHIVGGTPWMIFFLQLLPCLHQKFSYQNVFVLYEQHHIYNTPVQILTVIFFYIHRTCFLPIAKPDATPATTNLNISLFGTH